MNIFNLEEYKKLNKILSNWKISEFAPLFNNINKEYNNKLIVALIYNILLTLEEDIGGNKDEKNDLTGSLLKSKYSRASVVVQEDAVLAGTPWFEAVMRYINPLITIHWNFIDGQFIPAQSIICWIHGPVQSILLAERISLNFIQLLSGVASITASYIKIIEENTENTICVLDTRKTIPGLRLAQKYAVRIAGGKNQRLSLSDAILIKENHITAIGGVGKAISKAILNYSSDIPIQIEVETLDELNEALACGARSIILDNFSLDEIKQAVYLNAKRAILEVSGGVDTSILLDIANTGIDRISIGALTKNIKAINYSMRIE